MSLTELLPETTHESESPCFYSLHFDRLRAQIHAITVQETRRQAEIVRLTRRRITRRQPSCRRWRPSRNKYLRGLSGQTNWWTRSRLLHRNGPFGADHANVRSLLITRCNLATYSALMKLGTR